MESDSSSIKEPPHKTANQKFKNSNTKQFQRYQILNLIGQPQVRIPDLFGIWCLEFRVFLSIYVV
jgi:hypothetical protein